jgi:uncharacterized protein YkwD
VQHQEHTSKRAHTKTWCLSVLAACAFAGGFAGTLRAEDDAKPDASPPGEEAQAPAKQWVWLPKQGCFGFGYKRADGLWVIDPGTKRKTAKTSSELGGFLNWLNSTRARYGLGAVGHDPNLTSWAAANNSQQQARGMGHFVMGPASRQNCAVGSAATIGSQWMNSPAHRAALLDPSIRWIGLAGIGAYWTLNVR